MRRRPSLGSEVGSVASGKAVGSATASFWRHSSSPSRSQNNTLGFETEERFENVYDLSRAFNQLCGPDGGGISELDLAQMHTRQEGLDPQGPSFAEARLRYARAVLALNRELGISSPVAPGSKEPAGEVTLDTFIAVMQRKELGRPDLCEDDLEGISEIRDVLLKEDALNKVAAATRMPHQDIREPSKQKSHRMRARERIMKYLDPFIGLVILLNAIVIGVSTDVEPDYPGWQWCEFSFTLIFVLELCLKLMVQGPRFFFLGPDRYWDWFDTAVVIIAILDLVLSRAGNIVDFGNLTVVRVLRFARLTKLIRVLKLNAFKELALLVNGILAGFRTLVWAIVFLGFLLFALGVLMAEVVGHSSESDWDRVCDGKEPTDVLLSCNRSAELLKLHRRELFGNVPRAMFTIFRCFTDGCNSVDGTPLIPNFYNTYGIIVVASYMVVTLFVLFGLFNLIMAVFVENTIENAKHDDVRRREARAGEHLRVARRLQEVIVLFCTGLGEAQESDGLSHSESGGTWFEKAFATRRSVGNVDAMRRSVTGDARLKNPSNLSLKVSHDKFVRMLKLQEVQDMLTDLDICVGSRHALFDVLDANCNGTLEVSELVQGLLQLRGTPDKADVVASLLAIRSMQKSIKAMEALSLQQQEFIEKIASNVADIRRRRVRSPLGPPAADEGRGERRGNGAGTPRSSAWSARTTSRPPSGASERDLL